MPKAKTPTKTLLNRGSNLGKERIKFSPRRIDGDFSCPDDLDGVAAVFWEEQMPLLTVSGIISVPELPSFRAYCECWAEYRSSMQNCPLDFHTHVKLRQELLKIAMQFGLTPATRANVVSKKEDKKDEKSYSIKFG